MDAFSLPVDAFLYLWTLFTTCARFSLPMDAFHCLWARFTSYELFLNDYGLLLAEMGCLDGGLGDSLWITCGEDENPMKTKTELLAVVLDSPHFWL
jgi:hypothetical protein